MFTLLICGLGQANYPEYYYFEPVIGVTDFMGFFFLAAFFALPIAVGMVLWKNFVTNEPTTRAEVGVLGLDDRPSIYSEPCESRVSASSVLLYILTSLVTFGLGTLVFDAVQALN